MNNTRRFYNCKIYTPDRPDEVLDCFETVDDKFSFVGTLEEAKSRDAVASVLPTHMTDLQGKTVLPSFMDGHVHAPGLAYDTLFNLNLFHARSKEDTLDRIAGFVQAHPEKEIYYGRGVNAAFFGGEEHLTGPKKEHLDRICPDKPILIADFGGNFIWLNSAALEQYGVTPDTPVPQGGEIPVDPITGQIWGVIRNEARSLIPFQNLTTAENVEAGLWFQEKMISFGYTSIFALRPPGTVEPRTTLLEVFQHLENLGKLKMRIFGARDISPACDIDKEIDILLELKRQYDAPLVKFTTAKFFLDGVVEGADAFLLEPYEPIPGASAPGKPPKYGLFLWKKEKLAEMFRRCMENGITIHCHSIGDGAVSNALDCIQSAVEKTGKWDHRTTLTHLQLVAEPDKARMADLKVIADVQPYWHFKSPSLFESVEKMLLGERAESEYPLKSLMDHGVLVTASSDYPVTPEPNPFLGMQVACTRNLADPAAYGLEELDNMDDLRYLLKRRERATVSDMVEAFTINNAFAQHGESVFGSITAGKSADYIIVDRDPFNVPPKDLGKIQILETVFKSETVYKRLKGE